MKILYVASIMRHFSAFHIPYFKLLKDAGWEIHAAASDDAELPYVDKKFVLPIQRSPYKLDNIKAYRQLKKILAKENYDVIHCHTPVASVITRLASKKSRKLGAKIMYTAHGFQFFKGSSLKEWLVYYPVERFLSRYTDVIITINLEDFEMAKTFHAKDVQYIPGIGIDINRFSSGQASSVLRDKKRAELNIPDDKIVLLSIGELIPRKNHGVIIKALGKLKNPDIIYLLAGDGVLENAYKKLIAKLNIKNAVVLLGWRKDIAEICQAADIFIHPSTREGLGIAPLEAMACGLPIISTYIRGVRDYTINGETGYCLNDTTDVGAMADTIKNMAENKTFREKCGAFNKEQVKNYSLDKSIKRMSEIYGLEKI